MSEIIQLTEKDFESIEDILDTFDFVKVHKVMTFLNWGWVVKDEEDYSKAVLDEDGCSVYVPAIQKLRQTSRMLLKDAAKGAYKNGSYYTGTGGLYAEGHYEEGDKVPFLFLKFVLTEWSNEHEHG